MIFRAIFRGRSRLRGALIFVSSLLVGSATAPADSFKVRTSRGTFQVDVNVPDAQVRSDGDDLVITRTGSDVVRFRLPATRDSKISDEPVLVLGAGGKPAVTVRRAAGPPAPAFLDGPGRTVLRADRTSAAWSLSITGDGRTLVSGHNSVVRVWDLADATERFHVDVESREVRRVAVTPDGLTIATAEYSQGGGKNVGNVYVRDGKTGAVRVMGKVVESGLHCVAIAPDGKTLASSCWGEADIRLWDALKGDQTGTLKGHSGAVGTVIFSPDGKTVASAGDTTLRLWDLATGTTRLVLKGHEQGMESVGFSRDGRYVASGSFDHSSRVWDAATGRPVATLTTDDPVLTVALSPDGQLAATASGRWGNGFFGPSPAEVRVWDVARKTPIATMPTQPNQVFGMLFTPDGKTLITASLSGAVTLWDLETFRDSGTAEKSTSLK